MLQKRTEPPRNSVEPQAWSAWKGNHPAAVSPWKPGQPAGAMVLFDAECRFCVSLANGSAATLRKAGFALAPLQDSRQSRSFSRGSGHAPGEAFDSMVVLTPEGCALQSAEALVYLAKRIRWARPVAVVARHPFGMRLLDRVYAWLARNRFCLGGKCLAPVSRRWPAWLPLLLLLAGAFAVRERMEDWLWMWALSFSLFFGLKWFAWWNTRSRTSGLPWYRHCCYLFGWVGMDPVAFLSSKPQPGKRSWKDWARGIASAAAGSALVWIVVRFVPPGDRLLQAWTGLLGLILILHFGLFHLLALGWQAGGAGAQPIMRSPLRSTSLSEFWGRRWNLGFRYLSHAFVFQPLQPRTGVAAATVAAFLASGVVHDLVISLPARGGYGLPTAYFAMQAAGVLIERSALGKRLRLGTGWNGRAFAAAVSAGPVMLLFHDPFIANVALPMLQAIGAF